MRFIELKQFQKLARSLTCFALDFIKVSVDPCYLCKRWKEFEPAIYGIHFDTS